MVVFLMIVSFVAAIMSKRPRSKDVMFNISYLLGILLLISLIWTSINIRTLRLIRVTRARRAQVGRTMEERFVVLNTSVVPKFWLEVQDHSDLPDHLASHVIKGMRSKGRFEWRVNTVCLRRGRYTLGPMTIISGDPFGLFQMQRELTPTSHLIVYPMTVGISRFALPMGILPGGDALRRRTHYITPNAAGVRDYAPGDSFNRIHWPSSARRDRLIVKEFELDPLADIWLFPDLFQSVQVAAPAEDMVDSRPAPWAALQPFELDPSTEEYVVTVTASLAQHFLRRDRAIGMIAYAREREVIQADRGERQLNKMLETLAMVSATGRFELDHVLNAEVDQLPRGTTLIVITPDISEKVVTLVRHLERRGVRMMVVLIDPASFGGRHSAEAIAPMLRSGGTPTYVVKRGDSLSEVLSNQSSVARGYSAVA